ncbi:MAG: hypothetical protein LUM44_20045 [Pyrinomonadaceae bacterium]|nr:hypothetical protein [Pyrinomonadaceae bacterium]
MLKQSRFFFSAGVVTVLLISFFSLPNNLSAKTKRCPIELPKPLLSLYLQSEQVFIAEIADEKFSKVKTENPDEESYYFNVERKLDVIKTFKGQKLNNISFTKSEYRPAYKQNDDTEEVDEVYLVEGYRMNTRLEKGKRYLFFFNRDDENGFYQSDYRSGAREVTSENATVLEKRLDELGKIIAAKKDQLSKITEWLVKLTEDRQTRWDGAMTLSRSFAGLGNEIVEGEAEDRADFTLSENFNEYSPAIAQKLTESQKARLSDIFIESVNQHFFDGGENSQYDYTMGELVGNWDKARLAIYGFGILQSVDRSNIEKTSQAMNFVADMAGDSKLYDIYYEYSELSRQSDETEVVDEPAQAAVDAETDTVENRAEVITEKNSEPEDLMETPVSEAEKTTPEQLREQVMQKFFERYQQLLARNFEPEPEAENN